MNPMLAGNREASAAGPILQKKGSRYGRHGNQVREIELPASCTPRKQSRPPIAAQRDQKSASGAKPALPAPIST